MDKADADAAVLTVTLWTVVVVIKETAVLAVLLAPPPPLDPLVVGVEPEVDVVDAGTVVDAGRVVVADEERVVVVTTP